MFSPIVAIVSMLWYHYLCYTDYNTIVAKFVKYFKKSPFWPYWIQNGLKFLRKTAGGAPSRVGHCLPFPTGGVYWTKFECISDKIRRILSEWHLRLGRARQARAGQNPKISYHFYLRLPPHPPPRSGKFERKESFWVLLRRFSLQKEHYQFITFDCSFLRPHGDPCRF